MKNLLCSLIIIAAIPVSAQLKTTVLCPVFDVDLLEGKVNGIEPDYEANEIKKTFPCFTAEDASAASCGGLLTYKDKDIYFYTGRGYIEIREKFKGKLSLPMLGAARSSLFKWLGHPKIKDASWDAFQTKYGILILHYNKASRVSVIQLTKKNTDSIRLCE